MSVRAAPPPPAHDLAARGCIVFRHPGYSHTCWDYILSLPRVDTHPSEPNEYGVHHATALLACQIIGNNAFDGYLSTSRENPEKITTPADGVLMEANYFFIVPGNAKYPVVPSFQDWKFPQTEFESLWWPNITTGLLDLVSGCAVTQCAYSLEKAHLVPQTEKVWYRRNSMFTHSCGQLGGIDNNANLLYLRIDTHRSFDNKDWVIVPKPTYSDPEFTYAVHVLDCDKPAAQFYTNWHNCEVLNLQDNSKAYLFARFAWAVIQGVKPFLMAGIPRNIVRVEADKKGTSTWEVKLVSGKELDELYGEGGSEGATPRKNLKRTRSQADSETEWEEEDERSVDGILTHTPFDPVELSIRLEMIKRRKGED
ncbi:hypothetical protein CONLIGDRAFT_647355 [Coniochaeta ligniaria NRRL 30616]|uniref:HNH nuclease domain-containing protein n=1 Tax=Coniochaeta ligniaria NRRL 30616 TaxID=1408157 RepID=A0A1J7IDR2_9PEZI|nr:hypothetical protein CONLIGDRAFT_647355 [Coniochaeta ligniaria NRRL 30616]